MMIDAAQRMREVRARVYSSGKDGRGPETFASAPGEAGLLRRYMSQSGR